MGHVTYTVYAIPDGTAHSAAQSTTYSGIISDYLLGAYYDNYYEIPAEYQEGYYFAVCIMDRFSNEFEPTYTDDTDVIFDIAKETGMEMEMDGRTLRLGKTANTVQVANTVGQTVAAGQDCRELSLAGLPAGIYIAKALSGSQTTVKKIYIR